MTKRATTEEFIAKAKAVHGDKYDYSQTKYQDQSTKVTVICSQHGAFSVTPKLHLSGVICKKCVSAARALTTEEFIKRAKEVHGDKYDYSNTRYVNQSTKVNIGCKSCEKPFPQLPFNHLPPNSNGCPDCAPGKPKHTIEKFIEKARAVHGDKYDYSESVYTGIDDPITIRCKVGTHSYFTQRSADHLRGNGCTLCYNERRVRTTAQFIEEAKAIHGDKYDYSDTKYENITAKLSYRCPVHGIVEQVGNAHLLGHGCFRCYADSLTLTTEEFIAKAKAVHGDKYDYSNTVYKGAQSNTTIECPRHGPFTQKANSHLRGSGCNNCYNDDRTLTTEEFIAKARELHGNKYDYSNVVYTGIKDKVTLVCPTHGIFSMNAGNHLQSKGCPRCSESKGEAAIAKILDEVHIAYQREYKIPGNRYRYDFYLPDYKLLIEYHGGQHYHPIDHFGGEDNYKLTVERDLAKKALAKFANINMICFKYTLIRMPRHALRKLVLAVLEAVRNRKSLSWFYKEYVA